MTIKVKLKPYRKNILIIIIIISLVFITWQNVVGAITTVTPPPRTIRKANEQGCSYEGQLITVCGFIANEDEAADFGLGVGLYSWVFRCPKTKVVNENNLAEAPRKCEYGCDEDYLGRSYTGKCCESLTHKTRKVCRTKWAKATEHYYSGETGCGSWYDNEVRCSLDEECINDECQKKVTEEEEKETFEESYECKKMTVLKGKERYDITQSVHTSKDGKKTYTTCPKGCDETTGKCNTWCESLGKTGETMMVTPVGESETKKTICPHLCDIARGKCLDLKPKELETRWQCDDDVLRRYINRNNRWEATIYEHRCKYGCIDVSARCDAVTHDCNVGSDTTCRGSNLLLHFYVTKDGNGNCEYTEKEWEYCPLGCSIYMEVTCTGAEKVGIIAG